MFDSLYKSPVAAIIIYFLAIITVAFYVAFKYKNKRLFTIYNIGTYITIFTYVVITPFQFRNEAWYALGQQIAAPFYPYLYKSITINFLGFIIFLLSDMYFEQKKHKKIVFKNVDVIIQNTVIYDVMCLIATIFFVIYLYIVFKYNNGFPLFNGGRGFYYNSGILSYIYQATGTVINILGLYFGLYFINNNKSFLFFVLSAFFSISTGTRAAFFLEIIYPIILVVLYKKYKKINFFMILKVVIAAFLLVVFGLFIDFIRNGNNDSVFSTLQSFLYGNTFCDIRDGAYLFYGYENNFDSKILFGKTYLAGLISFIPSYLSKFRLKWSWGRFSTIGLFNGTWENHFGFRGGSSFEAYVNFRMPGVILFSILNGYFLAIMEESFSDNIYNKIKSGNKINVNSVFYAKFISGLSGFITISSGATTFYTLIVFVLIVYTLHNILPTKNIIKNI